MAVRKTTTETHPVRPDGHEDVFLGDDIFGLYRQDTMRNPRITDEELAALAGQVQAGSAAQSELDSAGKLTEAKRKKLLEAAQNGIIARNSIVEANTGLVFDLATKRAHSIQGRGGVDKLDLIQEGNIGLMRAAEKFNPNNPRKAKFSTHAMWWIRSDIGMAIHNQSRTVRLPYDQSTLVHKMYSTIRDHESVSSDDLPLEDLADKMKLPVKDVKAIRVISRNPISLNVEYEVADDGFVTELSQVVVDPLAKSVEELALDDNDVQPLLDEIENMVELSESLTSREKKVLWMRYANGVKSDIIADEVNCSKKEVPRIGKRALEKIRTEIEEKGMNDYYLGIARQLA